MFARRPIDERHQDRIGMRVGGLLGRSLRDLDPAILARLHAARRAALQGIEPRAAFALPHVVSKPYVPEYAGVSRALPRPIGLAVAGVLVAIIGGTVVSVRLCDLSDGMVDAGILSGERPLRTYAEPEFVAMVESSARDPGRVGVIGPEVLLAEQPSDRQSAAGRSAGSRGTSGDDIGLRHTDWNAGR